MDVRAELEAHGFKYYIFDWDDNILHMPTRIHMEVRSKDGLSWSPIKVTTSVFSIVRNDTENYRPPEDDWEKAFVEFRDFEHLPESQFLADTRTALAPVIAGEHEAAPSFHVFRQALVEGRLFGIVTARGHQSKTIRKGVEYFIEHVLTDAERAEMIDHLKQYFDYFDIELDDHTDAMVVDAYLSLGKYHAVTSPEFLEFLGEGSGAAAGQEAAKQMAIEDFVDHVIGILKEYGMDKPVSIGFSDDDPHNVAAIQQHIEARLSDQFPGVKFVVYDTSDAEIPSGRKVIVRGQLDLPLAVGSDGGEEEEE